VGMGRVFTEQARWGSVSVPVQTCNC